MIKGTGEYFSSVLVKRRRYDVVTFLNTTKNGVTNDKLNIHIYIDILVCIFIAFDLF